MFSEPKNAVASKFDAFKASVNNKSDEPRSLGRAEASPHSVIGGELKIVGNVTSSGSLELGGNVEGDVACQHVTVGRNGHVEGVIVADDVVIEGRIKGNVRGSHVSLRSNAHVDGDIIHTTLAIEEGAFFVGSSRSSDNPIEDGPAVKDDAPSKTKSKSANGKHANGHKSNAHKSNGIAKPTGKSTLALSADDVIGNDNAADSSKTKNAKVPA